MLRDLAVQFQDLIASDELSSGVAHGESFGYLIAEYLDTQTLGMSLFHGPRHIIQQRGSEHGCHLGGHDAGFNQVDVVGSPDCNLDTKLWVCRCEVNAQHPAHLKPVPPRELLSGCANHQLEVLGLYHPAYLEFYP